VALAAAALLASLLGAVPASAAPKTVWLCKPGKKADPCDPGLRTTVYSPAGKKLRVKNPRADRPRRIDCFYVYPTVSDQKAPVASLRIDPEERSIALFQAARYSQHCRVFAPMYRQVTIQGLGDPAKVTDADRALGYTDVRAAWRTYLKKYNRGRGVVLISHSQGTRVLRQLVTEEIDPKPAARRRLVSALLLGGNVLVKKGRDAGGDFKHVRACRAATQVGCVVAYSTFDEPVPADSRFGRPPADQPGTEVLCVNPAALGGGAGRADPIIPSAPFAPGTTIWAVTDLLGLKSPRPRTTWVESPGSYRATCSSASNANVLQVRSLRGAPKFRPSPTATWGLHLADANIALGNLVDLVRRQEKSFLGRLR
jgi:hypothetical protein